MERILPTVVLGFFALGSFAAGQITPVESVVSAPAATSAPADSAPSPEDTADIALDPVSLVPDLPSLPKAKATLIGGSVEKVDRLQDQFVMKVFGGGKIKMKILFDTRTRIYRDGQSASARDLRPGDRIYVDTILNGTTVFARNIRLRTAVPVGESQGVVINYRADKAELLVRDQLSPESLKVRITSSTKVTEGDHTIPASHLTAGTLVALKFDAQTEHDVAREISVLAIPGSTFTFVGQLTTLNLRTGMLILTSLTDHKTYEIYLDPAVVTVDESLHQGAEISILARFDGDRYTARTVTVTSR
jgi:hypothetical protein